MDRREDMKSHSCDLCGQGYTNRKDFDEHNEHEHDGKVMSAGDQSDRPQPLKVVSSSKPEPKAEEPKAEEPEAAQPTDDDEEQERTARAG